MIVFLSHKMSGIPEEEVYAIREKAMDYIRRSFPGKEITFIDNYHYPEAPEEFKTKNLYYLGKSIQNLGTADAIFFCHHPKEARGCRAEYMIARLYKVPVLNDTIGDWYKK